MKITMSKHVLNDRMERMVYIAQRIGWGEVIVEVPSSNNTRMCLTNTGVVLIKPTHEERLVTAYLANYNDVLWLYRSIGMERIPSFISAKVKKNRNHVAILAKMY